MKDQLLPPPASVRPDPTSHAPLLQILALWRPYYVHLAFGVAIAVVAALLGLGLTSSAASWFGVSIGMAALTSATVLRLLGVSRVISRYAERYVTHNAMFQALTATRVWFFNRLARWSAHGLGFRRSGEMLSRLVTDIDTLDVIYLRLVVPICAACASGIAVTLIAAILDIKLALLLGGLLVLLIVVAPVLCALWTEAHGGDVLAGFGALRVAALDYAHGLREARVYVGGQKLQAEIVRRADMQDRFESSQARRQSFATAVASLLSQLMVGVCVVHLLFPEGTRTHLIADIALLFVVLTSIEATSGLTRAGALIGKVRHAAARLTTFVVAPHSSNKLGKPFNPNFAKIRFENVALQWQTGRPYTFTDCNLVINNGERIAITGSSGAGKSSLVALVLKMAPPTAGRILIDDGDLDEICAEDLRRNIAWLSQSTHIFADTIRQNLCLDGTMRSDAELWSALRQAGLAHVIEALPEGLESWVGEGGRTLSGGEGRRLALARILISNAPVVILDEPTVGLDAEAERQFILTLNSVMEGRTLILIIHRLTGFEKLDSIWNLRDGQISQDAHPHRGERVQCNKC